MPRGCGHCGWGDTVDVASGSGGYKVAEMPLDAVVSFFGGPFDQSSRDRFAFEVEVSQSVGASKKRASANGELPAAKRPSGGKGGSSDSAVLAPKSAAKPQPLFGPIAKFVVVVEPVVESPVAPPFTTFGFRHLALDVSFEGENESEAEEKLKHKKHKKSQKK